MIPALLIISSLSNFLLGAFSFAKNPKRFLNVVFLLFAVSTAGWIISLFIVIYVTPEVVWARMPFVFGIFAVSFLLLFNLGLGIKPLMKNWLIASVLAIPLFLTYLTFSGYIVNSADVSKGFIINTFGSLYIFYVLALAGLVFLSLVVLFYEFQNNIGIEKLKIKYVAFGFLLFVVPATMTNLLLPTFFDVWAYNPMGPFFSFFMILSMSYAMVRYHLMDIWVVVRLGTIYTILFAIVSFFYSFTSSALANYVDGSWKYILPALVITFGFMPLKNGIEHVTDNIFFRKKFRYENLVREFNEATHLFGLNLEQLLQRFNELIVNDIRATNATIFLTIPKGNFISHQTISTTTTTTTGVNLEPNHPIVSYFHTHPKDILDLELLKTYLNPATADLVAELERLNFAIALPIVSESQLIGIYGIGSKKSQDPYGSEELELLQFLASESAHVIDNARYFEDLKKIDAAKSKFISITSHELRTPITSILWNLEFLISRNIKNKTVNEMLGYAYYSASFINDHLDEMLTVLDIEEKKGNIFLKKEKFQIADLIKELIDALKIDAKKKKILFDVALPQKLSPIDADRGKIKKVLLALIRNAVSYNAFGGSVEIHGQVKKVNGQQIFECAVSDSGMGISEEEKESIFSKFYRSDAARLASPNGFGISLFIAKHFIEAHGGELWFTSKGRDKGAMFIFKLPVEA